MTIDYDGPVGEHPFLNALDKVDAMAATAQQLINDLTAQRDSARTQYDNIFPALVATNEANAILVREIKAYRDELAEAVSELDGVTAQNDRLQNQNAGYMCRIEELEAERDELRETIAGLNGTR